MEYCLKCLTTNLRPNALFIDGVCIACRFSENRTQNGDNFDLKLKTLRNEIRKVLASSRKKFGKTAYDCIVGVSGGKDSTRQAHWVRDRLGLRPLLVCVAYPPIQMSEIGAMNLSNLVDMGFDLVTCTPAPQTSAALTLEGFKDFGNVSKATELALFSTVPRVAIEMRIPLIFWGENPAVQVGDSAVEGKNDFDGNNLRSLNTLTDGVDSWLSNFKKLGLDTSHYEYPSEQQFELKGVQIMYLGPAWDDWSNLDNAFYASLGGLVLRPNEEDITGDISNASMLDEEFTNINMMLKYFKYGFGRATDICNENIRLGKITREKAVDIVTKYDGLCDESIISRFCKYVGITMEEFWKITHKWVNLSLFEIPSNGGRPVPKFHVGKNYEN